MGPFMCYSVIFRSLQRRSTLWKLKIAMDAIAYSPQVCFDAMISLDLSRIPRVLLKLYTPLFLIVRPPWLRVHTVREIFSALIRTRKLLASCRHSWVILIWERRLRRSSIWSTITTATRLFATASVTTSGSKYRIRIPDYFSFNLIALTTNNNIHQFPFCSIPRYSSCSIDLSVTNCCLFDPHYH